MALRYAANTGNWSNVATWDGGASKPSAGDTVHANGKTVTIDEDIGTSGSPCELRTTAGGDAAAGGKFTTSGTRIIYANVEAGTTTCYDPASASTLIGNSKGGTAANAMGAALAASTETQTGNSTGGGTSGAYATYCRYGGIQNGNSTAGSTSGAHGTQCTVGGIQNGNSTGGGTSGAYATYSTGGGIHYGNATGGSTSGAHGTYCNNGGMAFITTATGNTSGANGVFSAANNGNCVIIKTKVGDYAYNDGAGTDTGLTNHPWVNVLAVYPTAAQVLTTIQFGNSGTDYTGTLTVPAVGDVQDGVTYGAGGTEYEGTLALPTEAQVESGVGFGAGGTEFEGELVAGGGPLVGASALISG
jgi:hypothetical protein